VLQRASLSRKALAVSKHCSKRPQLIALTLGPLPVDAINDALSLELEPGEVMFSEPAQRHAFNNHPEDFPKCLPHVGSVILNPLFVGDDLKNPGKIELISRIAVLESGLLVAISLELINGYYHVASMYPVSERKIEGRLEKRFLKRIKNR
jgi:hypothetical protein